MISAEEELQYLIGPSSILWRENTRHEAILLLRQIYECIDEEQRERVLDYIIAGPPTGADEEITPEYRNYLVAELLHYLEKKTESGITDKGIEALEACGHPRYAPNLEYPGIREYLSYSEAKRKEVVRVNVRDFEPSEAFDVVLNHENTLETDQRDVSEELGVAIVSDWEWGRVVLDDMGRQPDKFSGSVLSPVFWGMRTAIRSQNDTSGAGFSVSEWVGKIKTLVDIREDPELWVSVPGVLEESIEKYSPDYEEWKPLAFVLLNVFRSFDYDREDTSSWHSRAFDHPVGKLVLIYIKWAQEVVNKQQEVGDDYSIAKDIRDFFESVLKEYSVGTRYGICLLANQYSWFEAVDAKWAQSHILPYFSWEEDSESAIVVWAGYSRSSSIARTIVEAFGETYLVALQKLADFGDSERSGILSHVAAVFWFGYGDDKMLREVVDVIDQSASVEIVEYWRKHLSDAEKSTAEEFCRKKLGTAWKMFKASGLLEGDNSDPLRWGLIQLIPYSYTAFEDLSGLALQSMPTSIPHINVFLSRLSAANLSEIDQVSFIGFLIGVLKADEHPEWHQDDWYKLWGSVENSTEESKEELREEFARKNIGELIGV